MKRPVLLAMVFAVLLIFIQEMRLHHAPKLPEAEARAEIEEPLLLMLGVFRPLAVDYLWLRADKNYREGRYWELLADFTLLTRLQRRNEMVWFWHSYHLVYNLSAGEEDAKKQWMWVREGLELLGRGILTNPKSVFLRFLAANVLLHRCRERPYFQQRFVDWKSRLPSEEAIFLLEEAAQRSPEDPAVSGFLIIGLEKAGIDIWKGGDFSRAGRLLDEALEYLRKNKDLMGGDFFFENYHEYLSGLSETIEREGRGNKAEGEGLQSDAREYYRKAIQRIRSLVARFGQERGSELEGILEAFSARHRAE